MMTTSKKTTIQDRIGKALREAYPKPDRIAFLARVATWDLWNGPVSSNPESPYNPDPEEVTPATWSGFQAAMEELRAWAEEIPGTLYYDDDCGAIMTTEPEPWTDEETGETFEPSEYYVLEWSEIMAGIFPNQLCEYV